MARRRRDEDERERTEQAPMMGVLSVLLLLIPALMLMAHVTAYAQIDVSTPRFGGQEHRSETSCGRDPQFYVVIDHDGFYTRIDGSEWTRVGSTGVVHDHAALADEVWSFKQQYPHTTAAYVSARHDIEYELLVATLDTVRGPDCRISGIYAGEDVPQECLLWTPIIEHREPSWDVPEFRRGDVWPPRPAQELGATEPTRPSR